MNILEHFFAFCEKHNHFFEVANTYGEPGYTDPEDGMILFANWNDIPNGLADALEEEGHELEWSDEWAVFDGKAYRTQPNCYSWTAQFVYTDNGEPLFVTDSALEWASWASDCPSRCLLPAVDVSEMLENGWVLIQGGFESGLHHGQTDDPEELYEKYKKDYAEVVFRLTGVGQFDSRFEVYGIPKEDV